MTAQEFNIWANALRTYFPRERLLPNKEAVQLWYEELKDIPYNVATAALREYVHQSKWSPTIADIREHVVRIRDCAPEDWGEGWKQAMTAVSKYGYCNQAEALESLSGITRETVDRIVFQQLCLSENQEADRANFRRIYEQLSERKQKEAQLPKTLKDSIRELRLEQKANARAIEQKEQPSLIRGDIDIQSDSAEPEFISELLNRFRNRAIE